MHKKKFALSVRKKKSKKKKKLYKYSNHKNMSHETTFYIQGTPTIQPHLQNNSYGILWIDFHEHWIFVTTNKPTYPAVPLSIEWSIICSRFKKIDWDFVSLINISFNVMDL